MRRIEVDRLLLKMTGQIVKINIPIAEGENMNNQKYARTVYRVHLVRFEIRNRPTDKFWDDMDNKERRNFILANAELVDCDNDIVYECSEAEYNALPADFLQKFANEHCMYPREDEVHGITIITAEVVYDELAHYDEDDEEVDVESLDVETRIDF